MEFSPNNSIVQICLKGMAMEDKGQSKEAALLFYSAWDKAADDFERFLAAYYVARHKELSNDQLNWLEKSSHYALKVNSAATLGALPSIYSKMAACYKAMGDDFNETKYEKLAQELRQHPADNGPFYHGTKADLQIGDLLTPGGKSNYKHGLVMNHIYFTALVNGAGLAAALSKGEDRERVYIVEPLGGYENDPNVTDKKFPGNPSRSYRSGEPLKIIGEVLQWDKITPDQLQQWQEKLARSKGDIIN